jgi:hypothetical protein
VTQLPVTSLKHLHVLTRGLHGNNYTRLESLCIRNLSILVGVKPEMYTYTNFEGADILNTLLCGQQIPLEHFENIYMQYNSGVKRLGRHEIFSLIGGLRFPFLNLFF